MQQILVDHISKSFGDTVIFRNTSLTIQKGHVVGIIGANGSGKSVLFKMISGLYRPDSGEIYVRGERIGDRFDFPPNVGVFIDAPGFIQIFSGFKNLRMLADIKGTTSDEAIRDAMNLVGLESSCKTLVKNYSLGMKQKLGIAQAIMESQDILLLDEPFNALDESSHRRMCNVIKELKGTEIVELVDDDIDSVIKELGDFSANFFFNLTSSNEDKDKFMYKYLDTPQNVESGIILYRNAFSISSYEGKKDWLGLGKRSRKSPAAASHPSGAWRVRENQMAGYVLIDKKENAVLQDMANRQGLDENIYYQLFVEIILIGIKEFERYRQNIIRKINIKNQPDEQKATPVSDRVISKPSSINEFTRDEAKQLAAEIKGYKKEGKQYQKDKEAVEARYKYDIRILNVLATTGLKASSIAHEMKNDRNAIFENYNNIVDALKEYGMWDELNSVDKTRKSYKNVPYLLKNNDVVGKKLITFMDTMLEEVEKKQFEAHYQSIADILVASKQVWERDYAWLSIEILMEEDIIYQISEDILQVVFDNLLLNSVQQNDNTLKLNVTINVAEINGFLKIKYSDNGKGLDDKYKTNPRKILEVHETTRANGHGLGMWIVNNTCIMSGGEIQKIEGEGGFSIEFTIGGKL